MSDDECAMYEYIFAWFPENMILRFVTYRVNKRESEYSPWVEDFLWEYCTLQQPPAMEPPAWAIEEMKKQISNKIKVQ